MAFTEKKPSGKYQGRYRNVDGKLRSAGMFTQPKQALREAQRLEDEQSQPGALDRDGGKVQWGDWFASLQDSRIVAFATNTNYVSTAKNHILPHWENTRLTDIAPMAVSKWVKILHEKGASPYTIRNALTLFKTTLNEAVKQNRLVSNPANGVRQPDMPEATERYLTREEAHAIELHLGGVNAVIFWTAVQTGMRFGELAGLHWSRVDLDRGVVEVIEKYDQKSGKIDPTPKDRQKRTVPLPSGLHALLTQHYQHASGAQTCGLTHTAGQCTSDLVFRGPRGAVLRSNEWGHGPFKVALDLAGITDRVRVHDLRHTFASWLIQDRTSLEEIAVVMGHADSEVTRRYSHLRVDQYETVRNSMNRIMASGPRPDGPAEIGSALREHRRAERRAESSYPGLHVVTPDDPLHAC